MWRILCFFNAEPLNLGEVMKHEWGCLSFKIYKKSSYNCWNQLSYFLVGENILKEEGDHMKVNGISISPKKTFSILKIWFQDKNINETKFLNSMDLFKFDEAIYKAHS